MNSKHNAGQLIIPRHHLTLSIGLDLYKALAKGLTDAPNTSNALELKPVPVRACYNHQQTSCRLRSLLVNPVQATNNR